jgi:hypothetical protein
VLRFPRNNFATSRKKGTIIKFFGRRSLYSLIGAAAVTFSLIAFPAANAIASPFASQTTQLATHLATPQGIHEVWVYEGEYAWPTCDSDGRYYVAEGLASQYKCTYVTADLYQEWIYTLEG